MFKNYLLVALRSLRRKRGYAVINVLGLTVGIACCLLIALYLVDEWRHDRFHEHAEDIYRVHSTVAIPNGDTLRIAQTPSPMAAALEADFPEIAETVRLLHANERYRLEGSTFHEAGVMFTDAAFFDAFSFPLLHGDPRTALDGPNRIVLSEETARMLFGRADPIGQTLEDADGLVFTVTGVVGEAGPSHFTFDALGSMETLTALPGNDRVFTDWLSFPLWTYVRLREGTPSATLAEKLPDFLERHAGERMRTDLSGGGLDLSLVPLTGIYLGTSDVLGPLGPTGNVIYLRIFAFVALFVLLIAGINFTNLATARATERAKEVGVRKTLGATRGLLARQFLTESVLLSVLAVVLAAGVVASLLPAFRQFTESTLALTGPEIALIPLVLLGTALLVGLLAGAYPALILSGIQPAAILRGTFPTSAQGTALRKGLVVIQFGISVALLAGTAVVFQQLDHLRNQHLGFEADQMLVLDFDGQASTQREREGTIKETFLRIPGVRGAAVSNRVPGEGLPARGMQVEGAAGEMVSLALPLLSADAAFIPQYEIRMAAGRPFSAELSSDSTNALILNVAATRHLGYARAEEALGKPFAGQRREGVVVGVVEDFHVSSLHSAIEPMGIWMRPEEYQFLSLKVDAAGLPATLAAIERGWQEVAPSHPFAYSFLDHRFARAYRADELFGRLVGFFAGLAVFVACLGLFGLAAFTAEQRRREMGIRKVLGASAASVVALLSKDFLKLVLVAFALAAPVAYWGMTRWLEGFAYRIDLGPAVFLAAGALALAVALATVSYHALRAATSDPVKALRSE